ncbi:hypothetical protein BDY19DRAFT_891241 [Irpex rosettiformis]|uniref:Uncharacterized protein n=1 Tax=Irpex rosettiformis TaxID=378272 RepID=A0ACB8U245_9APHY|nr:hypothetical protein BDY19DRAFT_891241 [Irpex rosettiformis]
MEALSGLGEPNVDLEGFDYTKLKVKRGTFWVMQMSADGFVGPNDQYFNEFKEGYRPNFQVIIYDGMSNFRATDISAGGLPTSSMLLTLLKKAIASPIPPNRPLLPELFLIALKLSPHVDSLRPFLDSLPAPFTWRVETPEEAAEVASGVHEQNAKGVARGWSSGQTEKSLGNKALANNDSQKAVAHYTEAIESLQHAMSQNPTKEEKKSISELISVCFANRSAAWMLQGRGVDPKKALRDAEEADIWNENYIKAYYRQAKSHQLLGQTTKAIEVLRGALARPTLNNDKDLGDYFKELETSNEGINES